MTKDIAALGTESPRVSVLMPVYNADAFLVEAIESILGQTFTDFEFLILDDGSTDGSADIVRRYAEQDERIRFVSRENRGLPATLNEMAGMARGPYLARMDADDISLPDRFEKQVAFLDATPSVVAVGGQPLLCDENMRPIDVPRMPTDHETIDANNLGGNVSMPHPGTMLRATALKAVGGYDVTYTAGQDLDLWLRLAEIGQLANLEDIVFQFRLNDGSISGSRSREQLAFWRQICQSAWNRRGLPEQTLTYKEWRPSDNRASQRDFAISWGWRAWKAGNRDTARHFFLKAIRIDPVSVAAWKGLIFGTLRRPH